MRKLSQRDPAATYIREVRAKRWFPENSQCPCEEARPEAFVRKKIPVICHECNRTKQGKTTVDKHHVAGKSNNDTTILAPANDHRAELNVAQYEWPKETRENPDRSPLLAFAGCIRGFVDTVVYLMEELLLKAAELLEKLDAWLKAKLGPKYWLNTELEQFAPKGKRKSGRS